VTENEQTAQQLAAVRAAVQHAGGRSIVAEYAEDDRSGYKADRGPELERAMTHAVELAKDSAAVELWVWASNRLARGSGLKGEARSVLEVFAYLRRRGVTLRSVTDDHS
jgi:Resolvase, N terminal domain